MYNRKTKMPQPDYNRQHNLLSGDFEQTAYEMLIEQVVTGDRGYLHMVFEGEASEHARTWMERRDALGYQPEVPRIGVPREDYAMGGDDVDAKAYIRAVSQPVNLEGSLNRTAGWEQPKPKSSKIPRIS